MSRLFVNLYLDEDVSALIAALLRSRNLTAMTTQEAGESGNSDQKQLEYASQIQFAILTHNRNDFLELDRRFREDQRHHCGIIIAVRRSPYEITKRLLALLNDVSAEEMDDQVFFI